MRYISGLILLVSSPVAIFAQGWWLDESCTRLKNINEIKSEVKRAFELASETYELALDVNNPMEKLKANDEKKRIFDLTIGGDEADAKMAAESFIGVNALSPEADTENMAGLKIYCNLTRFKNIKTEDGKEYLKNMKTLIAYPKELVQCTRDHAWTKAIRLGDNFNEMQLCPSYAEKITNTYVPYGKVWQFWSTIARTIHTKFGALTEIDMWAYPHTTILHELMHTQEGRQRDDVDKPFSYRWVNVRKLVGKGSAYKNADNLMYFALALKLRKDRLSVNQDGKLDPTDAELENPGSEESRKRLVSSV